MTAVVTKALGDGNEAIFDCTGGKLSEVIFVKNLFFSKNHKRALQGESVTLKR